MIQLIDFEEKRFAWTSMGGILSHFVCMADGALEEDVENEPLIIRALARALVALQNAECAEFAAQMFSDVSEKCFDPRLSKFIRAEIERAKRVDHLLKLDADGEWKIKTEDEGGPIGDEETLIKLGMEMES